MAAISVPYAISWADEERDLTAWTGNELQSEAFSKLYSLAESVAGIDDPLIRRDWGYLQASNHFYYMSTKWFSAGEVHKYFNPYSSPYDAFINYMNAVSDFTIRVEAALKSRLEVEPLQETGKKTNRKATTKAVKPLKSKKKAEAKPTKKTVRKKVTSKASVKSKPPEIDEKTGKTAVKLPRKTRLQETAEKKSKAVAKPNSKKTAK